jgi:deazaflavin-dependent oxidoreductase (nitroreductase family)
MPKRTLQEATAQFEAMAQLTSPTLLEPFAHELEEARAATVGRRTGLERSVMVGEDGPNLVTMAMNGWGEGEPAWWLNLQSHPDARVDLADGPRLVTGRAASAEERGRLWARWREIDKNLDAYAARRSKGDRGRHLGTTAREPLRTWEARARKRRITAPSATGTGPPTSPGELDQPTRLSLKNASIQT